MPYPYSYDDEARNYKAPKLTTNRNMWKLMILNILTLGIYSLFFFIPFSYELDKVSPPREKDKTLSFLAAYILSIFTFSIVMMAWHYHIAQRIEEALSERGVAEDFGTGDFWMWYVFGSFILVGPFIYLHKLCKAMNALCEDYNQKEAA